MDRENQKLIALVVVGSAAFLYLYFTYLLTPKREEIQRNEAELATVNGRIEGLKAQALRRDQLLARVKELEAQVAAVEKRLPRDKNVQEIIRTVSSLADKNGVRFSSFSPQPEQSVTLFTEVPFGMSISGTVHSIGKFLAALGQQERIFSARNLSLNTGGDAKRNETVSGSFTLIAFVYNG